MEEHILLPKGRTIDDDGELVSQHYTDGPVSISLNKWTLPSKQWPTKLVLQVHYS